MGWEDVTAELADRCGAPHLLDKMDEPLFRIANWVKPFGTNLAETPAPRGDNRELITRARRAVEALFTSKPPVSGSSFPDTPRDDPSARKPRVLRIISPPAIRAEEVSPQPMPTITIPQSHFERIRTW